MSGPLLDLSLTSAFVDGSGKMVTSNRGSLLGTCQCGDGVTPATFPTLLGGGRRGMSFNGIGASNQRLVCASQGQVLGAGDMSVVFTSIQRTAGDSGWAQIITNAVAAGFVCSLFYDGANHHIYTSSNALATILDTPFDAYMRQLTTVAVVRPAVGNTLVYVNGNLVTSGNSGAVQVGDANLTIGTYPDPGIAARPMNADLFSCRAYVGALLTPTEIRALGDRDRATLNLF